MPRPDPRPLAAVLLACLVLVVAIAPSPVEAAKGGNRKPTPTPTASSTSTPTATPTPSPSPSPSSFLLYAACNGVNLRASPTTTATVTRQLQIGDAVTVAATVPGGAWSTTCVTSVSGATWRQITHVNGQSTSALYGVPALYGATGLFTATMEGIDVSHWQGAIDWARVAGAGKKFAFIKASEGQTFVDSRYATNRSGARANGIRPGAYHFARPDTGTNDARLEAAHFVATMAIERGDLLPVLDLEVAGGLGTTALQAWTRDFLDEVYLRTGARAIIYASPNFWRTYMGDSRWFADNGYTVLWIAHWTTASRPTVPASNWGGRGWTFWQYSDCGTVPGISGCVDLDRYRGTDLAAATY